MISPFAGPEDIKKQRESKAQQPAPAPRSALVEIFCDFAQMLKEITIEPIRDRFGGKGPAPRRGQTPF